MWIPGLPQAPYADWSSFYRTNGTGVALQREPRSDVPNVAALPDREFNLGPPDADAETKYNSGTVWLDHQFTPDLAGELSLYHFVDVREAANTELFTGHQIDVNTVLPNGLPNPKFGQPFAEAGVSRQRQDRQVDELRAMLTHSFRLDSLALGQRFSLIGGLRREEFDVQTLNLRRTGGPAQNPDWNAPENIVRYRLYWDEPLAYPLSALPQVAGYQFGFVPNGWFYHERKDLEYAQVASNTTLWDERLSLLLGARSDHVEREQRNPIYGPGPTELGPTTEDSASAVTYSAGAVAFPISWLGAFFNYSENFAPVTAGPNQLDGSPFGPTRGRGIDYGLKLNLRGGAIYATLDRYESTQTGRIAADPKIGIVRSIWRNFGATDPTLTTIDFRDTEALAADGYEFEITANLTRHFRLSAGFARPETATVDLLPGLRRYFDQHRDEWQAAVDNGTAADPVALSNDLDNLRQALESARPGTVLNGTFRYTANLYATYTFDEGPLKGLSIGAGAWGRGRQKIGSVDPRILFQTEEPTDAQRQAAAFTYLYAPEHYEVDAHVAYAWQMGETQARFQINVFNLLDDDDPIFLGYNVYRSGGIAENPLVQARGYFNYPDPRQVSFTASFRF